MKIDDKVWFFDEDRRVYVDSKGNKTGSPWYRGKFVEKFIIGETSRSWILGYDITTNPNVGIKLLKKNSSDLIYESEDAVNKACWVDANRYEISRLVEMCNDYTKLQRIKQILEGRYLL